MSKRPWMPLYIGDFLSDTMHLGATETGIYIRLIMHCWEHGRIPRDARQLALISHCDTRIWHRYQETVLQFFHPVDASTMHHRRVSAELLRSDEISSKRKEAGSRSAESRASKNEQLQTQSQSQLPLQKKKESPLPPAGGRAPRVKNDPGDFVPADFDLTPETIKYCLQQGGDRSFLNSTKEEFHKYWLARGDTKAKRRDWQAYFQSWYIGKLSNYGRYKTAARADEGSF
jgi:uncharacterized protein YdaU (DUF1376 family)